MIPSFKLPLEVVRHAYDHITFVVKRLDACSTAVREAITSYVISAEMKTAA